MRAQCAPRSPASLLLLLLLPGVGGCGDESSEGPVVTVSTQNAEVIMPEDSSGTDDKKTCTASKGSTDEILVTMGDWQIHAASFHTKATRKKPSDGEQLSEDEKLALLDDMIDDLVLSALAREAGLLSSAPAEAKLVQVLLQRKVLSEVDALHYTDAELRAWYEANRDKLVQPEQVQLGIITIRKSPRRSSEEALEQIQRIRAQLLEKPALFRDLATMYSEDPWRRRGGLPGWAPRTGKPGIEPAVLELAFKQEEGEFSHPLETSDGWVIVYTIALREAREKAWERSKGDVMREMKREKVEASRTRLLESLRSTAAVETLVDLASLELFGPLETMPQTPIARVNGEPILHIDLAKEASQSFPPGTVSLSLEERQATLQKRVDHELLVQEALRLQLEREDSVSKKLHELMEQQLLTESGSLEVTEDELFAYFQEHPEDYNRAPRVQLRRIILEINSSRCS